MLKRQDQDNGFSYGYENQIERDLAYAQKVLRVLRGNDKVAQEMGLNVVPKPQQDTDVQLRLYHSAVTLAGNGNIVTAPIKRLGIEKNFDVPQEFWGIDANFSPIEEILAAVCR